MAGIEDTHNTPSMEAPSRGKHAMRWFRFYAETMDDPKVQRLPPHLFKTWVNLLCLAAKNNGHLPCAEDIAFALHRRVFEVRQLIHGLLAADLLSIDGGGYTPHNWHGRQYRSDQSNQRVKAHRDRYKAVTVTPPDTEAETETERKKEDIGPAALELVVDNSTTKYAFESGVIKLLPRDLERWQKTFTTLDLRAELEGLAHWAGQQEKWFPAVSGALSKRHREILETRHARQNPPPSPPKSPPRFYRP